MRPIGSLNAFALGVAAGWLVTYLTLTHEKRTVKSIRKAVDLLVTYHDVTPAQSRVVHRKVWATDEEIWEVYRRVREVRPGKPGQLGFERSEEVWRLARMWVIGLPFAQDPTYVSAEVLLCTKVLGLTELHAWRTLWRSKTIRDIQQTLPTVTAELDEERRRRQEKEAADEAVRIARNARIDEAQEAWLRGDPDGFEKWLAAQGLKPLE